MDYDESSKEKMSQLPHSINKCRDKKDKEARWMDYDESSSLHIFQLFSLAGQANNISTIFYIVFLTYFTFFFAKSYINLFQQGQKK